MQHPQHIDISSNIKVHIDYPCAWNYRIIGLKKEVVLEAITQVFGEKATISPIEHFSSHHKYIAINCSIQVESDEERTGYFDSLVKHNGIIMVI